MRISIRNQLAGLVLLSTLLCLAIISIAVWFTNHDKLSAARAARFAIIASLKAAQISTNLALMERSVRSLSTRVRVQAALLRYNQGNNTADNWVATSQDLQSGLSGGKSQLLTLQTILYPVRPLDPGDASGLVNVTGDTARGFVELPYSNSHGGQVPLGQLGLGYPPDLYPNLTYVEENGAFVAGFHGQSINADSVLLLGPLLINATTSLISMTVPIINNTSYMDIMGYMTVVMDNSPIWDVVNSSIGLTETGTTLLIGPDTINNMVTNSSQIHSTTVSGDGRTLPDVELRFVLPLQERYPKKRHAEFVYGKAQTFHGSRYSLVLGGLTQSSDAINNAGGTLSSRNEENMKVGLGYAKAPTPFCDWLIVVEFSRNEAWGPINAIQNVMLACIFATAFGAALWTFPIAYWGSAPIRRLREATTNAVESSEANSMEKLVSSSSEPLNQEHVRECSKDGLVATVTEKSSLGSPSFLKSNRIAPVSSGAALRRFRIPQRVKDRKHWIEDDLTDLTKNFNQMSDELNLQYSRIEERVRQRTAELELSKKAAEAANESKTLFIANISHELKTPLNGILGMCAVALSEEDPLKIKRSLNIIYKSGELLHHLLNDLLTFSRHQAGKNLSLEEKEFRLRDVGTQLHAIFHTQARDGQIDFTIEYQGPKDAAGNPQSYEDGTHGPDNTGKVKDMVLWGDVQRILQVCINLVSNSLKFTPKGGTVKLCIRCVETAPAERFEKDLTTKDSSRFIREIQEERGRRASLGSLISVPPPEPSAARLVFEFEVEDTGPGVPQHLQTQIFEPFVQGDLRLTKKFGGTGLGLSICSQLSKLMHGTLHLQSEVGQGSTFTLHIPLRLCRPRADSCATSTIEAASGTSSRTASPEYVHLSRTSSLARSSNPETKPSEHMPTGQQPRLVGLSQPYFASGKPPMASPNSDPGSPSSKKEGKLKVLVAEDNTTNAEVVTRMLKLEEVFDVSLAKDGQEALELVKQSMAIGIHYDLILMDVQMPMMDGRESTRMIRDLGYSAPIVALTAFSDEINKKECMDSGMDYFLPKPIKRPALKQVLKTYCPPILEEESPGTKSMNIT